MTAQRKVIFLVLTLLLLISSCTVLSFHPLYTKDVLKTDDRLIGTWYTLDEGLSNGDSDTLIWEVQFKAQKLEKTEAQEAQNSTWVKNEHTYTLSLYYKSKPDKKAKFQLHLIELDNQTYLDFFPESWDIENPILFFHLMGVHTFAKVDIVKSCLKINWFDANWFEEKLSENKIRIKHEKNSANILLTAQPKDLQKFVIKYANDEHAFDKDAIFQLKPLK